MSFFQQARNVELSTIQYLETQINANWDNITTTKSMSQSYSSSVNLPIVCVRMTDFPPSVLEIGSNTLEFRYGIIIDIFATSDGFRIDLADFIMDKLKDGWTYNTYAHASGDNSSIEATAAGRCKVTSWTDNRLIELGENVDKKDRHRHMIAIQVKVGLT